MNDITESLLQIIAGTVGKLLLENREQISFGYNRHGEDGIKVTVGITLDPSPKGVSVSYDMGFDLEPKSPPPEKHKVKFQQTIAEDQAEMEFGT